MKLSEQLKKEKARFWPMVSGFSSQRWGRHNGRSLRHLVTLSAVRKEKERWILLLFGFLLFIKSKVLVQGMELPRVKMGLSTFILLIR